MTVLDLELQVPVSIAEVKLFPAYANRGREPVSTGRLMIGRVLADILHCLLLFLKRLALVAALKCIWSVHRHMNRQRKPWNKPKSQLGRLHKSRASDADDGQV